jgi:hypothetical protein
VGSHMRRGRREERFWTEGRRTRAGPYEGTGRPGRAQRGQGMARVVMLCISLKAESQGGNSPKDSGLGLFSCLERRAQE